MNKKKAAGKNPDILDPLETQISAADRQIDRLVYELYNFTKPKAPSWKAGRDEKGSLPVSTFAVFYQKTKGEP